MRLLLAALLISLGLASAALAQRVQNPQTVAIGCAYNTSPPTLTSGWFGFAQCDSAGSLIISGGGGGGGTVTQGNPNAGGALAWPVLESNSAAILAAIQGPLPTQPSTVSIGGVGQLSSLTWTPVAPAAATATNATLMGCQYNSTIVTFTNGLQGQISCGVGGEVYIGGPAAASTAPVGNPLYLGGVFNNSEPAPATGQISPLQVDSRSNLRVMVNMPSSNAAVSSQSTAADAISNVTGAYYSYGLGYNFNGTTWDRTRGLSGHLFVMPGGFSSSHISTATTTTAKSGAGSVHTVCVNTLGTVASTVTVYDNTAGSGTVIAVINSLAFLGCQIYDVAFATGLTLVTTGTAAPDVTVSYR